MTNVFEFRKHKRPVVIAGKEYTLDCSERSAAAIDYGKAETDRLRMAMLDGEATAHDVKAVFEGVFRAVLGEEAVDDILERGGEELDLYDYADLALFLGAQFRAYHDERLKSIE